MVKQNKQYIIIAITIIHYIKIIIIMLGSTALYGPGPPFASFFRGY
jgi:hypothetical protein